MMSGQVAYMGQSPHSLPKVFIEGLSRENGKVVPFATANRVSGFYKRV